MTRISTRTRPGDIARPAYEHAPPRLRASQIERPQPIQEPTLLQRWFRRA